MTNRTIKNETRKAITKFDYLLYEVIEVLDWNYFSEKDNEGLKKYILKFIIESKIILNRLKGKIENGKYN